jgi:hypothetical protein
MPADLTTASTITAYAAPTLHAPVEILDDTHPVRVKVRTLPGGVGGWATPGREVTVNRSILSTSAGGTVAEALNVPAPTPEPLTEPISGEDYMSVLLARQAAWRDAYTVGGRAPARPPLLEHFVLDADVPFVVVPDHAPKPKPKPQPRQYRSAESLRAELAKVEATMDRVAGRSDTGDRAAANLSPSARSRAARTAGRRRFAQMDRDLERYTQLRQRASALASQIARAEAREAAVEQGDSLHSL